MRKAKYRKNIKQKETELFDLSPEELKCLNEIFQKKGWKIEADDDNLFDSFCKTLGLLKSEQRKLVLELTENFQCVEIDKYYHHFVKAFDKYIGCIKKDIQEKLNVYIVPLISEEDFGKIKSSTMLYYLINARSKKINDKYKGKVSICLVDMNRYDTIDERVAEQFKLQKSRICLIDDFIVSGKTANSAVTYLTKNGIVSIDKISVVSIAAMQQGINTLNDNDIRTYCSILCNKAITGTGDREQERKSLMMSISEKIGAKEEFYFGFEQSEALIKMVRTPNNTFPIYWYKNKNKNPPFPR